MNRRNTITAVLFLLLMTGGLLLLATSFFGREGSFETLLKTFVREKDPSAVLEGAESAINQDLDRDHLFIQLYGGVQRITGRRVVEDMVEGNTVAKLTTGAINFVNVNASDYTPDSLMEFGNVCADTFQAELEALDVPYVDLRPMFESNGIYSGWFFNTDHHWKPEAAFFAWQNLAQILDERYGFHTPTYLTQPSNWTTTVLDDFFLGSQGKRVGSLYAGVDDFTIYTPKFETSLTYSSPTSNFERTGSFNESVCFPERVEEKDWFNGNPYTYYSGGDYALATMTNHKNPNGPRIVLLRESFSCALAPFLALSCSELTTIDLRHFQGDLMETIEGLEPDLVMTLYTASTTGLDNMFAFEGTE